MPKPGYFDGTEAQVVLEPSSFARELAASARGWADAKRGKAAAALATDSTTETTPQTPQTPPLAEARGRDPRSGHPGGWVRVRVIDSCAASGNEGGLRFCVEVAEIEGEEGEKKERLWLPLAWLHPSSPNPVLAIRPLPPSDDTQQEEPESSWSAGDEAEIRRRGEGSWWPATILRVEGEGESGEGGDQAGEKNPRTLVVRIEPCCCFATGAVVGVPFVSAACASPSSSASYSLRKRPPLPPLFEEEAARLQLEQERAERSGRLGGGFGSRGGVLGSGRRWSGMATSFGESVHPEEWRKRTAGLLPAEEEGEEGRGGGDGSDGGQREAAATSGPAAGVSSGARTHLIAGFSMEAALCPGQLSTAAREEEEEAEEVEEEGEGEGGEGREGAAAAAKGEEGQPKKKRRRKTTTTLFRANRDPFGYDAAARALLEAGGSL